MGLAVVLLAQGLACVWATWPTTHSISEQKKHCGMAEAILAHAARLVPALGTRKGLSGRVAVIGGSEEYTGAPFLAGMSALRTGADLVHVVCPPSAAVAIKSYSPDLIVHPWLTTSGEARKGWSGLVFCGGLFFLYGSASKRNAPAQFQMPNALCLMLCYL